MPSKPRKASDMPDPELEKRKSSIRIGPKMTPEERKMMEETIEEEARKEQEDMGVMMERSKKAGKLLCGISC